MDVTNTLQEEELLLDMDFSSPYPAAASLSHPRYVPSLYSDTPAAAPAAAPSAIPSAAPSAVLSAALATAPAAAPPAVPAIAPATAPPAVPATVPAAAPPAASAVAPPAAPNQDWRGRGKRAGVKVQQNEFMKFMYKMSRPHYYWGPRHRGGRGERGGRGGRGERGGRGGRGERGGTNIC